MTFELSDMLDLPEGYIPSLTDSGQWRNYLTHWHLARFDTKLSNKRRFDQDGTIPKHIAEGEPSHDPHEALQWVMAEFFSVLLVGDPAENFACRGWHTPDDLQRTIDVSWELMVDKPFLLTPIGGLLAISGARTTHIHAYPMTQCQRH